MHLIEFWQVVFSQPHDGTRKYHHNESDTVRFEIWITCGRI